MTGNTSGKVEVLECSENALAERFDRRAFGFSRTVALKLILLVFPDL
ncbi:MAG: hypothetical protein AAGC79_15195 [Pseudomonadota bacterium]